MLSFTIFALFFIVLGIGFVYWATTGIRRGAVASRGGHVARKQNPIAFWMLVTLYSFMAPFSLFAGLVSLRAMWLGCAASATMHTCNPFQSLW